MVTDNEIMVPFKAVHPGELLREELVSRGIKQVELAKMIGVKSYCLFDFIKGKWNLDEEFAGKLEKALDIPASFWINLQNSYYNDCKVLAERNEHKQRTSQRASSVPAHGYSRV